MFLDDDVVLKHGTVAALVSALEQRPGYGAIAADYLGESQDTVTHHVAMGATLFRRAVLDRLKFRWEPNRCECRCCCDDLRRLGYGVRYMSGTRAIHLKSGAPVGPDQRSTAENSTDAVAAGHILAALDRRHLQKFRRQFYGSLRRSGNNEPVTVVGYGLYPSECGGLECLQNVTVIPRRTSHVMPPVRRLRDFQQIVARLPAGQPVAYWDAADVLFQGHLDALWRSVLESPDKLLAVREPKGYPANPAIWAWCLSIRSAEHRDRAFELLRVNPFLNSGFVAGTARTMLAYFHEADRMRCSSELQGTTDWGDQMALNLYCHSRPDRWREIDESWNYCVHDRQKGEVEFGNDGRIRSRRGFPIQVVHGNAHSFRHQELYGY
jgi:hypothetical protein